MTFTYFIDSDRCCVAVLPISETDQRGFRTFKAAKRALLKEQQVRLKYLKSWLADQQDKVERVKAQKEAFG